LTLATGATNLEKAVRFWDLQRGSEREQFLGPHSEIELVKFLEGGTLAAVAWGEPELWLWNYESGKNLGNVATPEAVINRVAFASSRPLVAFANAERVHIHDYAAHKRNTLAFDGTHLQCLDFSPDGTMVAVAEAETARKEPGTRGFIRLYSVANGKLITTLTASEGAISQLSFSPDGSTLAIAGRGVQLWDVRCRHPLRPLQAQPRFVDAIVFSNDGQFLAAVPWYSAEQPVIVWEVGTGEIVAQVKGGQAVTFSPDGRWLVVGDHLGSLNWWDLGSSAPPIVWSGHKLWVRTLAFSATGSILASGSRDSTVLLWDAKSALARVQERDLSPEELRELWADLASASATVARRAARRLVLAGPSTDAYLKERRPLLMPRDQKGLSDLIQKLDSEDFEKRETASRDLEALSLEAEESLLRALHASRSPELTRRITEILQSIHNKPLPAAMMRQLRVIQVLEQRGSPLADELLRAIANGAPDSRQSREANRALVRRQRE
jgi:WD40 repeat protein